MRHVKCYMKDYPRPQFVRADWENLNGAWDFAFDYDNIGEKKGWQKGNFKQFEINVPFSYQTINSGINIQKRCDNVWYFKKIDYISGKKCILNFEGSDYITKVWINGQFVGSHQGGYTRFGFDITNNLKKGGNNIVVKVEDSYDCYQPRGKQRWLDNSYGCWYVDTTGIWKTVWLEYVSNSYIEKVSIKPDLDTNTCSFEGSIINYKQGMQLKTTVSFDGVFVCDSIITLNKGYFKKTLDLTSEVSDFKVKTWTHYDPNLYDVEYSLIYNGKVIDVVGSYFGVVKYAAHGNLITQNGTQFYSKMLLDQGYFENSGLTPPNEEAIIEDIDLTKKMGFNGIRKHQKIEDDRFYYYCDILGVVVWCEMPSPYDFSLQSVNNFTTQWIDVVSSHLSHPSIMAWVPFNESWGVMRIATQSDQQALTEGIYHITKALDPSRFVISNDGWEHTKSDIITLHNYAQWGEGIAKCYDDMDNLLQGKNQCGATPRQPFANGYKYEGQPIMISEYAGIAFSKDKEKGWGYGQMVDSSQVFLKRLESLTLAIKNNPAICGYCVTQTTDVEQEVNGLLYADRKPKVDIQEIAKINNI